MSASEATTPIEGSAQPTRWPPGDVSKNQLYESAQGAGDPRGEFVQFREKLGRVHEGNTGAARKSFRKKQGAAASKPPCIETAVWRPPLLGCRLWRQQLNRGCETAQ